MITFANDEGDLHILALKPKRKLSSGWMEFKDFCRKHSLVWSGVEVVMAVAEAMTVADADSRMQSCTHNSSERVDSIRGWLWSY